MPEFTDSFFYKLDSDLFGKHPKESFLRFQWLSGYQLHKDLKRYLESFGGRVLDVGCGEKPYREWCNF